MYGEQNRKEATNQCTTQIQKKSEILKATTFPIEKLEERYLYGEKNRKVQYYRNIEKSAL